MSLISAGSISLVSTFKFAKKSFDYLENSCFVVKGRGVSKLVGGGEGGVVDGWPAGVPLGAVAAPQGPTAPLHHHKQQSCNIQLQYEKEVLVLNSILATTVAIKKPH